MDTVVKKGKWNELICTGDKYVIRACSKATNLEQAWEKTLEKWELTIYSHEKFNRLDGQGACHTCGLCDLYYKQQCKGCPIEQHTGESTCEGTPYDDYGRNHNLRNAKREYEFLLDVREQSEIEEA